MDVLYSLYYITLLFEVCEVVKHYWIKNNLLSSSESDENQNTAFFPLGFLYFCQKF